ncbi:MAG TPA: hypothetical protein VGC64_01850 [Pyrinomonadaceae bacterium]|jgi:hypothetical protein
MTAGPRIELYIEELVLHGFARGDRYAIADAVERELSRLLAAQLTGHAVPPALAHNTEHARMDAGTIHLQTAVAASVGTQLAQAVHGVINE